LQRERRRSVRDAHDEVTEGRELGVPTYGTGHDAPIVRLHEAFDQTLTGWNTRHMAFTIFEGSELEWVPRGDDDPRSLARLSEAMTHSRANIWRYPPGSRGKRHADHAQEEVFVVLDGTLTVDLGEPPERHKLAHGSVLVVEPGTALQLRNADDEELVLFIYGAPPVTGQAEFFEPIP
jgi:mannose-6-phosphate isomerase-like protein (cupin superfamily)